MKVLVTGCTGFIGNYIVENLLKLKEMKIVGTSIDPVEKAKQFKWFNQIKYISYNLNEDNKNCFEFFENPDLLIHLSWEGLPNYNELFHFEKNLFSNYFFIKNMVEHGLGDVNVIGTCLEYGMINGCLSEDLQTNPITPYGLAKDTLRKFVEQLNLKYNFAFKWIRLFYLYGKGQNPKSLLAQLDKALDNNEKIFNMSNGEQLRDYLPVEKVAEYIVKISLQRDILGIVNCCSGIPISIRKLVEMHLKKRNKEISLNLGYYNYPDYEPLAFWGDSAKLNRIITKK